MDATSEESPGGQQPRRVLFGFIAIGLGMITKEQLNECLVIQQRKPEEKVLLGRVLLDKGYLTVDQIKRILSIQQHEE